MTIRVHVKYPGVELAELQLGEMRYVLARSGIYLERRTSLFATSTRVTEPLAGLEPHQQSCRLSCGKIPRLLIRTMLAFFRAAYVIHEGEAALVLLYHPGRRTFRWHCPDQFVETYRSLGRLCAYDFIHFDLPLEIPDGYVIFGDSHCHGSLSAVPSRVDERDESFQDGLHLIVGHIDRPRKVQYHADFVMDGYRFNLPPASVLDDVTCEPLSEPPRSWLERIHLRGRPSWGLSTMGAYRDERQSE